MRNHRRTATLLSVATILLAAALIWQCSQIYLEGTGKANLSDAGVYIHPIYTREIVARHIRQIGWAFGAWIIALAAALVGRKPESKERRLSGASRSNPERQPAGKAIWRRALYAAGIALLIAGICNGGASDVLIKAINICTECIGLG